MFKSSNQTWGSVSFSLQKLNLITLCSKRFHIRKIGQHKVSITLCYWDFHTTNQPIQVEYYTVRHNFSLGESVNSSDSLHCGTVFLIQEVDLYEQFSRVHVRPAIVLKFVEYTLNSIAVISTFTYCERVQCIAVHKPFWHYIQFRAINLLFF